MMPPPRSPCWGHWKKMTRNCRFRVATLYFPICPGSASGLVQPRPRRCWLGPTSTPVLRPWLAVLGVRRVRVRA
uniref:Uncharacterized protein n=1 Tax=Rhizophora mucronata TaxID=61149 RepID=A0A2P2MYS5_RHIMU